MVERDRASRGADDIFPREPAPAWPRGAERLAAGSRTVDAVLDDGGTERVELLKMDIEGAEDHSPRATRRAADGGRVDARDLVRPLDAPALRGALPRQPWTAPGEGPL